MKNGHELRKQVGLWIRVSTEDQVQGDSPEHHEHRGRMYAEMKGWDVVKIYKLEAVSGKSVKDHELTQEMIEDIKMGRITGLIFSKLARLARNTKELLEFADTFEEYNADLISLQEAIDTSSPAGRLFYTMIAAMAQWEREEISSRVAASVPVRATLGKPLGGPAPFGFQWINGKIEPDPDEAPILKKLFELFDEHKRKKTVARILNNAGYRTRQGRKFSDSTIGRLLQNPIAKGKHRRNYSKSAGVNKHWVLKPEREWVWNEVEPVIPEELWSRVNAVMESRKRGKRAPGRKPSHLFSGLTYCHCGTRMYIHASYPKYICKSCRNKIPEDDLENLFYEQFKQFWSSPVDVDKYLDQADDMVSEKKKELEVLEKELKSVSKEMDKVYALYVQEKISADGFGRVYGPLEERRKELETEQPQLLGEIDFLKIQYLSSDQIKHEATSIYSLWHTLDFKAKREIIDNVVIRIEVKENEVHFQLANPAQPPFLRNDGEKATQRCPCGYFSDPNNPCSCSPIQVQKYLSKISGPLLDRIDMHIEVSAVPFDELSSRQDGEPSNAVRERVVHAREIQHARFNNHPQVHCNAQMISKLVRKHCNISDEGQQLMKMALQRLGLSARAYDRILKVSRTIADLAGAEAIETGHIAEAIQYRALDRKWGEVQG